MDPLSLRNEQSEFGRACVLSDYCKFCRPAERDFERGVASFQRLRQFCDFRRGRESGLLSCVISRIGAVKKLKWCFERERDNIEELL
ncbi:hypothetical protein quinque_013262 [Culex quinquefasciatus]